MLAGGVLTRGCVKVNFLVVFNRSLGASFVRLENSCHESVVKLFLKN